MSGAASPSPAAQLLGSEIGWDVSGDGRDAAGEEFVPAVGLRTVTISPPTEEQAAVLASPPPNPSEVAYGVAAVAAAEAERERLAALERAANDAKNFDFQKPRAQARRRRGAAAADAQSPPPPAAAAAATDENGDGTVAVATVGGADGAPFTETAADAPAADSVTVTTSEEGVDVAHPPPLAAAPVAAEGAEAAAAAGGPRFEEVDPLVAAAIPPAASEAAPPPEVASATAAADDAPAASPHPKPQGVIVPHNSSSAATMPNSGGGNAYDGGGQHGDGGRMLFPSPLFSTHQNRLEYSSDDDDDDGGNNHGNSGHGHAAHRQRGGRSLLFGRGSSSSQRQHLNSGGVAAGRGGGGGGGNSSSRGPTSGGVVALPSFAEERGDAFMDGIGNSRRAVGGAASGGSSRSGGGGTNVYDYANVLLRATNSSSNLGSSDAPLRTMGGSVGGGFSSDPSSRGEDLVPSAPGRAAADFGDASVVPMQTSLRAPRVVDISGYHDGGAHRNDPRYQHSIGGRSGAAAATTLQLLEQQQQQNGVATTTNRPSNAVIDISGFRTGIAHTEEARRCAALGALNSNNKDKVQSLIASPMGQIARHYYAQVRGFYEYIYLSGSSHNNASSSSHTNDHDGSSFSSSPLSSPTHNIAIYHEKVRTIPEVLHYYGLGPAVAQSGGGQHHYHHAYTADSMGGVGGTTANAATNASVMNALLYDGVPAYDYRSQMVAHGVVGARRGGGLNEGEGCTFGGGAPAPLHHLNHQHPHVLRGRADPRTVASADTLFAALRGKYGGGGSGGNTYLQQQYCSAARSADANRFPFIHYHV